MLGRPPVRSATTGAIKLRACTVGSSCASAVRNSRAAAASETAVKSSATTIITVREKLARYCTGNFDPLGCCLRVSKKVQADVTKESARPRPRHSDCALRSTVTDEGNAAEFY